MAFLKTRNNRLDPRFRRIAHHYRKHGEAWRVRWDYAFYQMAIETNFLSYRRPNGKWGDVKPSQNNFAGIGTTGGGVPGNSFPDVSTGVLAQIQHLVVYSGEQVANPVADRTRLKQEHILRLSKPVAQRRPVTFQDLSGRWAVDKRYGRSIAYVARLFASRYCKSTDRLAGRAKTDPPARRRSLSASAPTTSTSASASTPVQVCKVQVAGTTGDKTLLIRSREGDTVHLTALEVQPGSEDRDSRSFIAAYAKGGRAIGSFVSRARAIEKARVMCRRMTSSD